MEIKTVNDCINARVLRKIKPDIDKSNKSIDLSKLYLREAKGMIVSKHYRFSVVSSYTAMFHSARSLLYADGYQEKSHLAIQIYINEKYSQSIPMSILRLFEIYRHERHNALYGFDNESDKDYAESALNDANKFVSEVNGFVIGRRKE